jgi:hypothetical protein
MISSESLAPLYEEANMAKRNAAAVAAWNRKAGAHSGQRKPLTIETEGAEYCPYCSELVLDPYAFFIARRGQTFSFCDGECRDEWQAGGYRND